MEDKQPAPSDIQRLYDVCNKVYTTHNVQIDELAHAIAKDFDSALEAAGFALLIPIEGAAGSRNSIEYLLGLSRITDLAAGWFRLCLGLTCLWHTEPGEYIIAQVPDGGR